MRYGEMGAVGLHHEPEMYVEPLGYAVYLDYLYSHLVCTLVLENVLYDRELVVDLLLGHRSVLLVRPASAVVGGTLANVIPAVFMMRSPAATAMHFVLAADRLSADLAYHSFGRKRGRQVSYLRLLLLFLEPMLSLIR